MRELYGKYEEGMLLADTHVHTNESPDARNKGLGPYEVVDVAVASGLSAIVITNHHTIYDAEEARNDAVRHNKPITVYVGVEVTTRKTGAHVVGINVDHPIPPTETVEEAIEQILYRNGKVVIPHAFHTNMGGKPNGIQKDELLSLIERGFLIHGFEVYSQGVEDHATARPHARNTNTGALEFFQEYAHLLGAPLSSSDTHRLTVGRARTGFSGDLLHAIDMRTTVPLKLEEGEMVTIYEASLEYLGEERMNRYPSRLKRVLEKQEL